MPTLGALNDANVIPQPGTAASCSCSSQISAKHKWQSALEVLIVYGLIECALWSSETLWRVRWSLMALGAVIVISLYRRDLWPRLGLGVRGLGTSLWIVPAAAALGGLILLGGHFAGTLHGLYSPRLWYVAASGYLLWALQQEYLVQAFFLRRCEALLGNGHVSLLATVLLFSMAHIPNPILMATTFAMGAVFVALFRRYQNLYPLALAHATLGLSLSAALPEATLRHMRVGIGYLMYVAH